MMTYSRSEECSEGCSRGMEIEREEGDDDMILLNRESIMPVFITYILHTNANYLAFYTNANIEHLAVYAVPVGLIIIKSLLNNYMPNKIVSIIQLIKHTINLIHFQPPSSIA